MNRFLKNVAWLQGANLLSLLIAFLIQFAYFLKDDVLGKEYFGFYLGLFVIFETYRLLLSWEPGDIMIKAIAEKKGAREACNQLAHQGFCFAISFASLCALCIYLTAPITVDFFFTNWISKSSDSENTRQILITAIKSSAFIPLFHSLFSWAIALLQAKEHMKASTPLVIAMNLSRPIGALGGFFYAKHSLDLSEPLQYFPHMINGIIIYFAAATIPLLFLVKLYYYGLLTSLIQKPWTAPPIKMCREICQLSSSKKIIDLYNRFPMWLALFYLSPVHFTLMTLCLKVFEYSKMPFAPVSKTLLPQLARLVAEKRYKYIASQVRRVNAWGFSSGLLVGSVATVLCLYLLFPHLLFLKPEDLAVIQENAFPLLGAYLFIGFSITNGVIFIVFNMTAKFLKLSLIQIPICAFVAYYLISQEGFFGVSLYFLFYNGFINLLSTYFAHQKIKSYLLNAEK